MPVSVTCQSCFKSLKAPDHLVGKRVKCPACGAPLEVTDAFAGNFSTDPFGSPAPAGGGFDQDYGGDGGTYTEAAKRTGWGRFHLGLAIVAVNALVAGGMVGALLNLAVFTANIDLLMIIPWVLMIGLLAQSVGFWFCSEIPRETGERGLMQVAFLFFAPGAVALTLFRLLELASFFKSMELALILASALAAGVIGMVAAQFFYIFSLRGVTIHLKNASLTGSVFGYLIYSAAAPAIWVFYQGISPIFSSRGMGRGGFDDGPGFTPRGMMDLVIVDALLLVNLLWFVFILKGLRDLIGRTQKITE